MIEWQRFTPTLLSTLRLVTALLFIEHGTAKLFQFPLTTMFRSASHIGTLGWFSGTLESVGGALVLLGLFTRPVAFLLAGEMAIAYWTVHAPRSLFPIVSEGDAAILFCFVFLYLSAAGGGPWSVDALLGNRPAMAFPQRPSQ